MLAARRSTDSVYKVICKSDVEKQHKLSFWLFQFYTCLLNKVL